MNCHGGGKGGEAVLGLDTHGPVTEPDGMFHHARHTGKLLFTLSEKHCLSFHVLTSLAAFVAFTLPYHRFAYCTGLQYMRNNIDFFACTCML